MPSSTSAIATDCDVAVVGAGPVGLKLALLLQISGHSVQVFEKHRKLYPQPRAVALFDQSARSLDEIGLHEKLDNPNALCTTEDLFSLKAEIINNSGDVILSAAMPVGKSKFAISVSYMLFQPGLEAVLEEACLERGIKIFRYTNVEKVEDKGTLTRLLVQPRGEGEAPRAVTAKFCVGCDGASSTVRQCAQIPLFKLREAPRPWLIVDVVPKIPGSDPKWGDWDVARQYADWARPRTSVPSPTHRRRWEFALLNGETETEAVKPEFVWRMLSEFGCTPEDAVIERAATYYFKACWSESMAKGRLSLAGDAAHLTPPFLAQGLNSGLRDVKNLAWRLDLALRNPDCNWPRLMDDYNGEQLEMAKMFVTGASMLERMINCTDRKEAETRDEMMRQAPSLPPLPTRTCLQYPGTFMHNKTTEHPNTCTVPGCTFLHDHVDFEGKVGFFDVTVATGWILLGDSHHGDPTKDMKADTAVAFQNVLKGKTAHFGPGGCKDVTGRYNTWFETAGVSAVLTRPDYYIYGIAKTRSEVEPLVKSLLEYVTL